MAQDIFLNFLYFSLSYNKIRNTQKVKETDKNRPKVKVRKPSHPGTYAEQIFWHNFGTMHQKIRGYIRKSQKTKKPRNRLIYEAFNWSE